MLRVFRLPRLGIQMRTCGKEFDPHVVAIELLAGSATSAGNMWSIAIDLGGSRGQGRLTRRARFDMGTP